MMWVSASRVPVAGRRRSRLAMASLQDRDDGLMRRRKGQRHDSIAPEDL